MLHEVAAGAELEVVADRGGGGGDLAERHEVAAGAELEVSPIAAAAAVTSPSGRPW